MEKSNYFYHVVSDVPKRKGEHIVMDEQHPNRVHLRVYKHLDEVRDIHANPQKYVGRALSHEVQVALRELALEKARKEKYPQYPSRMAALYVSKTFEEAEQWGEYFASLGRPTYGIARVKANGRVFEGDAYKCFDGTVSEKENLRLAEIYWENGENEDGGRPIVEIIADGDIEIVEIVKEINANIHEIVALPKERWKGTAIPMTIRSDSYYDFEISPMDREGCAVSLVRKPAEKEIVHTPEEYDFPDSLYQDHWEKAEAYGVVSDAGELMACVEVCPEEWSNRLMVTELWVCEALRGKGIGKQLMDKAKEVAVRQKRRAVILETQSCNTNAIGFYLSQGFEMIGFDTCCYTNNDIGRREVRINLGYFFHGEGRRK